MADGSYIHLPDSRATAIEPAVWRALDAVAEKAGLAASALARKAGLDPTTFNPSKRQHESGKHRTPTMRSVHLACQVAGVSMAEFGAMVDQEMGG